MTIRATGQRLEGTGEQFSLDELMYVRARTRRAVHMIADQVEVGMAEEEAKDDRPEHPDRRWGCAGDGTTSSSACGPNTTKDFMERSEPGVVLGRTTSSSSTSARSSRTAKATPGTPSSSATIPITTGPSATSGPSGRRPRSTGSTSGSPGRSSTTTPRRGSRGLGMEAEPRPLRTPSVRLPPLGPLRRIDWPTSLPLAPQPLGARDRHRPSRAPFGAFYEDLLLEDQSFPDGCSPRG